mgnify:CR=1 FL=1
MFYLAMSIITGDEKSLTAAQGVGKKIAQRVPAAVDDRQIGLHVGHRSGNVVVHSFLLQ